MVPADSDNAAMATQTVLCPGAYSINDNVNDSLGGVGKGLETSISISMTPIHKKHQPLSPQDLILRHLKDIQVRKKAIWSRR